MSSFAGRAWNDVIHCTTQELNAGPDAPTGLRFFGNELPQHSGTDHERMDVNTNSAGEVVGMAPAQWLSTKTILKFFYK